MVEKSSLIGLLNTIFRGDNKIMATANPYQKLRIGLRTAKNLKLTHKPLCVSFEVTHSCNCNCRHCDKGGLKKEENLMKPADYLSRVKELSPAIIQISGGEPLVREDILEVVKAIRSNGVLPYIVFVTNSFLLTEEKYLELKAAGVDRFSISLDFPDERHDEFRRLKGVYSHIEQIVPYLVEKYDADDIGMNCAITKANFRSIVDVAKKVTEWNVPVTYSAYSKLRTGDEDLTIRDKGDLEELKNLIDALIKFRNDHKPAKTVMNAESTLRSTYEFFANGGIPGCLAGERFLVVRPDNKLNACSMFPEMQYDSQKEMIDGFKMRKECADCYVAIRAYSGKSLTTMFREMVGL